MQRRPTLDRARPLARIATGLALLVPAVATVARALPASASSPPDSGGATPGSGLSALLAELPAEALGDGDSFLISAADVDAASAIAGVPRPSDFGDPLFTWLMELTGVPGDDGAFSPVFVPFAEPFGVMNAATLGELDAATGWTLLDVERFAAAEAPPDRFLVATGAFDDSTLSSDLVDLGGGVMSLGEGEDYSQDLMARNAMSNIGVPQRMAVRDGAVVVSPSTPAVQAWLDGTGSSVLDDPQVAVVASELDDAVSLVIAPMSVFDPSFMLGASATPEQIDALVAEMGAVPSLGASVVGIGWMPPQDGRTAVEIVYPVTTGDPAAAADSLTALYDSAISVRTGMPLSERFDVTDVRATDDAVVVSLLLGADQNPNLPYSMLMVREVLFQVG